MNAHSYQAVHPFSYMPPPEQMKEHPFICLERGQGSWVYDTEGNQYLYATTAVPSVGLGNPRVIERMVQQLQTLSFGSTCEQTHPLLIQLADRILKLSGNGYDRVFFSNDGSGAVETAMRFSRQYFAQRGESRRQKFISLEGAYHGTTYGSGSVTHLGIQESFGKGLDGCVRVPAPNLYRPPIKGDPDFIVKFCLDVLEEVIHEEHPHSIAAVLIEPIQGVNGIIPLPAAYITGVRDITRKYGIHLIVDEVATGVGRTGQWLASHCYGIEADFVALSKGLTGGFFPMGATLLHKEIGESLFGKGGIFLHGSTQSGHPVGCAAALETLDILQDENLMQNARELGAYILQRFQEEFIQHPNVGDIRGMGLMLAIEFVSQQATKEPVSYEWGARFSAALKREGILGNFFNSILLMYPPLNLTKDEAEFLVKGVLAAVRSM
ncbi:aminotransferase family protein [Brevibacillus migulae]|uniref:aminotransferase family protein n=1 Tax=Brevibacillus migulae TaxID=1644114 RepID=UPI00106ED762|nr:aminotransferase class III-fold pyridoxal phosphate-dependent enzyme [Brevibacillus migulae]